jgi:uncharacterized protein (DUF1684 family)
MPDLVIRGAQRDIAVEDGIITVIGPDPPAGNVLVAATTAGERFLCLTS